MERVFLSVLNMSLTASFVIAAILLARLPLKKAPRVISYALWGVAGFRLAFPFSFESIVSLLPVKANPIPRDIMYQTAPHIDSGITAVDNFVSGTLPATTPQASVNPLQIWLAVGTAVWIAGIVLLLMYSLVTIWLLNRRLRDASLTENNIYEANNLKTPFVLGFLRPRIYLPAGLEAEERGYILLHEQTHIRRHDHMIKQIAYLILCVHWFNPFAWLAFILMCADMELSCDERVLRELGADIKKAYSSSLLSLAMKRRILSGSPLAFGEGGIKARIKNVLNFKKTSRVIIVAAVALVAVLSIGLAVNRMEKSDLIEFQCVYSNVTEYSYNLQLKHGDTLYSTYIVDGEMQNASSLRGLKEIGFAVGEMGDKYRIYEREGYSIDDFIVVEDNGFMNPAVIYAANSLSITIDESQTPIAELQINQEILALLGKTFREIDTLYGLEFVEQPADNFYVYRLTRNGDFGTISLVFNSNTNPDEPVRSIDVPASVLYGRESVTLGMLKACYSGYEYYIEEQVPPSYTMNVWLIGDSTMIWGYGTQVYSFGFDGEPTDDTPAGKVTIPNYRPREDPLPDFPSFDDAALLSYCLTSDGAYSEGSYSELVKRFNNDPLGICRGISKFDESEQNWLCRGLIGEYAIEERVGDLETILTNQSKGVYSQLPKDVIVIVKIGKILDYMTGKTTGTTESFVYRSPGRPPEYAAKQLLAFEVTNVLDSHIETYEDDGGTPVELIVINYLPGAELRFIDPDMEPGEFYEDGLNRAQWYLGYFMTDEKNAPITDEIKTVPITSDLRGIYNLEASLYVVLFVAV